MTKEAFSPELRATEREAEDIPIGDRIFKQVRRIPKVMRGYRAVVRQDEDLARANGQVAAKLDELDDNAPDGQRQDLVAQQVEIEDQREDLTYQLVLTLIKARDGEEPPTLDFLQEHLDMEDLGKLLDRLTPGESEQQDPTPAVSEPTGN